MQSKCKEPRKYQASKTFCRLPDCVTHTCSVSFMVYSSDLVTQCAVCVLKPASDTSQARVVVTSVDSDIGVLALPVQCSVSY